MAAPAPQAKEESQGGANEREVTRFAGVVAMDMAGFSSTGWAGGRGSSCSRSKHDRVGVSLELKEGQSWKQEIQWVLRLHGTRSPSTFYET